MSQELLLDPKQEILEIIETEGHKYQHVNPYVRFDDEGKIVGCCVNGLVMLKMGWNPKARDWKGSNQNWDETPSGMTYNDCAIKMRSRYGERIIEDINRVNANIVNGWSEAKTELSKFWFS